ncbi:hypothetical protein QL093DRAFT_2205670, partial [Fusarium oxysporum]
MSCLARAAGVILLVVMLLGKLNKGSQASFRYLEQGLCIWSWSKTSSGEFWNCLICSSVLVHLLMPFNVRGIQRFLHRLINC